MKNLRWISCMGAIISVIVISCSKHYQTIVAGYAVEKSPAAVDRGRVLVYNICAGCHYNRAANKFIGNRIEDVPSIAGSVYSANLTQSFKHGLPVRYSDAELKYLLKTGVAADGRFIPYMLRPNMADEDINDIIVFLRSADPAVAPADTTVGITHYNVLGKIFMNLKAKPLPYLPGIKKPSEKEPVALGQYLVDNLGCFHCHSKSLTSLNYLHPELSEGYMAGGLKLKGERGMEIHASNITPDKNTGIGNYTQGQFIEALKTGKAPNRTLHPPMPKFDRLNSGEIGAIYAYIQTIPARHRIAEKP